MAEATRAEWPRDFEGASEEGSLVFSEADSAVSMEFLSRMRHDFLAPIRAIRHLPSWIEEDTLAQQAELSPEVKHHLNGIVEQAGRLHDLVLAVTRYQAFEHYVPNPKRTDMGKHLSQLVESLREDHAFEIKLQGALPPLVIDTDLLDLVISAFVQNSVLHSEAQGLPIVILCGATDFGFEIEVTDWGIGIPHKFLERAFQPFSTLQLRTQKKAGVGLGLPMALAASVKLGGHIRALNTGVGLSMTLCLPPSLKPSI